MIVWLASGCGRRGFDAIGDGAPVDSKTDAFPLSCTLDEDCGRCQRCSDQRCETADFVQLSLGFNNSRARDERGEVWCWGGND